LRWFRWFLWGTAVVLLGLVLLRSSWVRENFPLLKKTTTPTPGIQSGGAQPDFSDLPPDLQKVAQAFLALESSEQAVLEAHFAPELEARIWENRITERWDALNAGADPATVWNLAPNGEVRIGTTSVDASNLPPNVRDLTESLADRTFPAAGWGQAIALWRDQGWTIQHSEWRMSGYSASADSDDPMRPQGSVSTDIDWVLLLEQSPSSHRLLARGHAVVSWETVEPYRPVTVEVDQWRIFSTQAPVPMKQVAVLDIPASGETPFADPVVVTDFLGDGQPDFVWVGAGQWLQFRDDAARWTPLKQWPKERIWAAAIVDVDRDGWDELLLAGREGLRMLRRRPGQPWEGPGQIIWRAPEPLLHPQVLAVGDVDGDGWPDVWLGQYKLPYLGGQFPTPYFDANDGFPSYLLIHPGAKDPSGKSTWRDATLESGLGEKRFRRTYSASWIDLTGDGALDWVGVSDFAGVDVFLNDGQGKFEDVTAQLQDTRHLFGMGHVVGDFLGENRPSIFVLGMDSAVARRLDRLGLGRPDHPEHTAKRAAMTLGNRLYRATSNGLDWVKAPDLERAGWAWGVTAVDLANRGVLDFFVANGHETRASTRDYERHFWGHDIYVAGSRQDPLKDAFFRSEAGRRAAVQGSYGGWYHQALFWNQDGTRFAEMAWVLGLSWSADGRQVVADDWNGDGRMDLVLSTQEDWPVARQRVVLWENQMPRTGHWIGFRFPEGTGPRSPLNARVEIQTPSGKRSAWIVCGDSFRTQHRQQVHFGLGQVDRVESVRIHWAHGDPTELGAVEVDRWHAIPRGP